MTRILIIDDEKTARADLRALLAAHPQVVIAGEAALIDEARGLLKKGDYDLVFLDIQLLGGTGFDLVPDVRPGARIVFVTAHDLFALRAFEVNALDYLLKPVRVARLAETLARVAAAPAADLPPAALRSDDVVYVKTGPGAARFVPVAEIVAIHSDDNYSHAALAGGERLFVRQTLAAWEARLPPAHFMRVHRQTLVNLARVRGFEHAGEETTLLRMAGLGETVRARRHHWPDLRARLAGLGIAL